MGAITQEQLENADVDAQTFSDVVNGAPDAVILSRLGRSLRSLSSLGTVDAALAKVISVTTDYTVQAADVATGFLVLRVTPASALVTIKVPPSLGGGALALKIALLKLGTTAGRQVALSDGTNVVDTLIAPASATGRANAYRDIYPDGTNLNFMGAG